MQQWVQGFLDSTYLYFESADASPGVRMLVPNYGDYVRFQDITGAKYKSYSFVFVGYEQIDQGTSDNNTHNMEMFDSFLAWIEEQKRLKNFPDFGEKCSEYDIIILQNMAGLAEIFDDNLAKYIFGVRIDYKEEE
jgi:hypothetical protein